MDGSLPAIKSNSEESPLQAYMAVTSASSRLAGVTEGDCMAASSKPLFPDRTANLTACWSKRAGEGGCSKKRAHERIYAMHISRRHTGIRLQ